MHTAHYAHLRLGGNCYVRVLSKFWTRLGQFIGADARQHQWFQQDGAAPHVSRQSLQWISDHFENRRISRSTDCPWSANSPDLNPLDFHLWGYLKDGLFGGEFETTEDMKDAIKVAMRRITPAQCERVIDNFVSRARKCIDRNGGHLEHVL